MRHPFMDDFRYKDQLYKLIDVVDKVINFFNHYYVTTNEGWEMLQCGQHIHPDTSKPYGAVIAYVYDSDLPQSKPKYIKTPIVRISYDGVWDCYTSNFNHTVACTISDTPKLLQQYRPRKKCDISIDQMKKYMGYVAENKNKLLELWYNGDDNCSIPWSDANHIFSNE